MFLFLSYWHHSINGTKLVPPRSILRRLQVEAAKRRYGRVEALFWPSVVPYCACPASKEPLLARTHVRTEHTWGNVPPGKSSISFMAFSGKVSSSPINRPPHHLHHLHLRHHLRHISICISFWFTSENDPLQPIYSDHSPPRAPPRDNWSKLGSGICAPAIPDKTSASGRPTCLQFVRQEP